METPLTLNNVRELIFSKLHSLSKTTLGCYIVKTTGTVASNDAPHEGKR